MNCCDDYGDCRQGRDCPVWPGQRSCDELGVCQGHCTAGSDPQFSAPESAGAPRDLPYYPFAPGVIEGPGDKVPFMTRAEALILAGLVLAVIGSVLAGYLTSGWLS